MFPAGSKKISKLLCRETALQGIGAQISVAPLQASLPFVSFLIFPFHNLGNIRSFILIKNLTLLCIKGFRIDRSLIPGLAVKIIRDPLCHELPSVAGIDLILGKLQIR